MFRTTLRSIAAHKLRLFSTAIAIVIGVAFVTGTLVLTDTLRGTFDELFDQTSEGIDVAVRGPEDSADQLTGRRDPVPQDVVDEIVAVEGVDQVSPEVEGFAQLIDDDGEPIGGFGPPTLGFSAPVTDEVDNSEVREGRYPTQDGEMALDLGTAEANDIAVGDEVDVVIDGPVETFTVTGLITFGDLDNLAGATLVILDLDTAVQRWGQEGFHTVYVLGEEGVDPADLRDDVAAALGGDWTVETGAELSDSLSADVGEGLGFFTTALLVFAGVSLFVGAFLIANTFSIIVAQRTRELALLRAVGASRRQVMLSVMGEALATGIIGSLLGFLAGLGLAQGLYALLDAFGISLPQGALVIKPATFIIAMLLGTVLTVLVALVPAFRGTRVPPVTAMQAVAAPPPPRYGVLRYIAGGLVFLAGIGGVAAALSGDGDITAVGAGAVVTLLGAALLAPLVTKPLLKVLGAPIAAGRGMQGQLATENALRNPRRTAATASALMIGLALVSFIVIMASSLNRSVETAIDDAFAGEFQISPTGFFGPQGGLGDELVPDLQAVDGVAAAVPQYFALLEIAGNDEFVSAFEGDSFAEVITVDFVEGDRAGYVDGGLAVSEDVADNLDLALGDPVTVRGPAGEVELVLGAISEANPVLGGWIVDVERLPGGTASLQLGGVFVNLADDADPDAVRPDVEAALVPYPTLQLQDLTEVKQGIRDQIGQLLGLLGALLALSVIVALFGIVNTLGLSVFERTRELGLLRAVGATRSQVRSMIRWESVLIAILGAVFGLLLGVLFAWLVITALGEEGGLDLVIPYGPLVGGMIAAAIAGVLAAIIPARRASRIDILRSLEAT